MLLSLFMAAFAAQVADDGFSKLQIFLQQLIDWGVNASLWQHWVSVRRHKSKTVCG